LNITTITHVAKLSAAGCAAGSGGYRLMYIICIYIYIYNAEDGILNILRFRGRVHVCKVFDRIKKTTCIGRVMERGQLWQEYEMRKIDAFYRLRRFIGNISKIETV